MGARRYLRGHLALTLAFLYLPIAVLVVLSFNDGGLPTAWGGFSLRWYREVTQDPLILSALKNTLIVAASVTAVSIPIGTLLAIGLQRVVRSQTLDTVLFLPAVIPDIVLAIGLLSFFNFLRVTLGLTTIVLAHMVFDVVFVASIVRTRLGHFDRTIEEAAADLYAGPVVTFLRVTLPAIAPGIIAGGLVAFTLSVDEFVIAFFTAGPSAITFPIRVYAMIRFGVTPEINAVATAVLLGSLVLVFLALRMSRRGGEGAQFSPLG